MAQAPAALRSHDQVPGLGARRVAAESIAEVLTRRTPLDDALDGRAADARLTPRDAALARAVATVALRRFGTIRHALAARMARGLPKDGALLAVLVTGAAQVLFLDVPDHAAVDLAVRLARSRRDLAHAAAMINAVLRRVARERDAILASGDPLRLDTPEWLARRWTATNGETQAHAIAAAHQAAPSLDLTVKDRPEEWAARLGGLVLPTGSVRVIERTPVPELPGYADGDWWPQDAAAAIPARLLRAKPGERIADLCAAPGGKTAQLASAGARVVAVDKSAKRLRRLAENMARLRLEVEVKAADVLELPEDSFDAVLLDAPCSATGTIRRHPDVPWTKREDDVRALAEVQARMLDKAAALVRPGGRLVYCTCSLEPEEGERQVDAFLNRQALFRRVPVEAGEVGGLTDLIDGRGDVRTLPSHLHDLAAERTGLDGFFVARMTRAG